MIYKEEDCTVKYLRRSDVSKIVKNKKLIGFGAGVIGKKTVGFLGEGMISYFIDNNAEKAGMQFVEGVNVYSLDRLANEDIASVCVVICTEQYAQISKQLIELYPDINMLRSPVLIEFQVFDTLLNCSERLLVSSYGANGGLYLVNGRTEQYRCLKKGAYRGLLICNNKLYVASERGDIYEIVSMEPLQMELKWKSNAICQMHGMAYWARENRIFAAEAKFDRIAVFDARTFERVDEWYISISNDSADVGVERTSHVNDLTINNDTLFISQISQNGWWKQGIYDGCISQISLLSSRKNQHVVMPELLFPHSVKFIAGEFYVLEAATGCIRTGKKDVHCQLNGFLRGLDGNNELLYIGQSRNRRIQEALRYHSPVSMDSGIYVFSREHQVYRFIKMPEMCDIYNILDIDCEHG